MSYDLTVRTSLQIGNQEIQPQDDKKSVISNVIEDDSKLVQVQSATKVLYDAAAPGAIQYALGWIESDEEVELELTAENGDPNEELALHTIKKGGPPFVFTDATRFNHAADDAYAGTAAVWDLIRVRESNGLLANVRIRLFGT